MDYNSEYMKVTRRRVPFAGREGITPGKYELVLYLHKTPARLYGGGALHCVKPWIVSHTLDHVWDPFQTARAEREHRVGPYPRGRPLHSLSQYPVHLADARWGSSSGSSGGAGGGGGAGRASNRVGATTPAQTIVVFMEEAWSPSAVDFEHYRREFHGAMCTNLSYSEAHGLHHCWENEQAIELIEGHVHRQAGEAEAMAAEEKEKHMGVAKSKLKAAVHIRQLGINGNRLFGH